MLSRIFCKLAIVICALFSVSCSSDEPVRPVDPSLVYGDEVEVVIGGYRLTESGSMYKSRGSGFDNVYDEFYDNYIANNKVCPDRYKVNFYTMTDTLVYSSYFSLSAAKQTIRLKSGKYKVVGTSDDNVGVPKSDSSEYIWDAGDSVFVKIEGVVEVNKNSDTIMLPANYNCALMMFPNSNRDVTNMYASVYELGSYYTSDKTYNVKPGNIDNTMYYLFVRKPSLFYNYSKNADMSITFNVKPGLENKIASLKQYKLNHGSYYVFDPVTMTFVMPKMTPGE